MTPPRILLVEDDPVTRTFLAAAAEALPARVDLAATLADARHRIERERYDVWLVDAHLPDGEGVELLTHGRARGDATPALAHTAAREPDILARLRDAGFIDALVKPLTASTLQAAIRAVVGAATPIDANRAGNPDGGMSDAPVPVWDESAALAALGGQPSHVAALRALFLEELPATRDAVAAAAATGDHAALRAALHRLRASCGFTGAARLSRTVARLHDAAGDRAALDAFVAAAQDTLSSR